MIAFAIDPATRCGFAVFKDGEPVACGTWRLGGEKWTTGARIEALALELDSLRLAQGPPEILFYEKCFGVRAGSGELQHGLIGYIQYWCSRLCVPCAGLSPSTIKKQFAGHGRAEKWDMIAEAQARWPKLEITSDNTADALAIGAVGLKEMEGKNNG